MRKSVLHTQHRQQIGSGTLILDTTFVQSVVHSSDKSVSLLVKALLTLGLVGQGLEFGEHRVAHLIILRIAVTFNLPPANGKPRF